MQESEKLYIDLKKKICRLVYDGTYVEGERIPPERILTEQFGVSRITVRKTLELLEQEGLVIREIGRGTTISFHNRGFSGSLDVTALVAPARSTFFSEFIEYFQRYLDQNDSLLMYIQKPEKESIENCLYRLYQKDIRNVVVWPDDSQVDAERLRRLRALGMNMVFFDTDAAVPYADCVFLDNKEAISRLMQALERKPFVNGRGICYIGWDNAGVYSVREREHWFREIQPHCICIHMCWAERGNLKKQMAGAIRAWSKDALNNMDFLCGAGELGIETAKVLRSLGLKESAVMSVDEFPDSKRLKVTTYGQDFRKIAQQIYECLKEQNEGPDKWKASCWGIKGNFIQR